MRILVMSWRDTKHPLGGGAEQVMHEHMKGWIVDGHEVTLFSSKFRNSSKCETIDGVKVIRKGDQHLGVKLYAFLYYLKNVSAFDLVVDEFHGLPFFTPLYVKKPKFAVLQEIAREVWFMYKLPFGLNYLLGGLAYLIEPFIFLLYKNVPFVVGSNSAKEDLTNIMNIDSKNVTVIPHGVILEKSKKYEGKENLKTLAFLGALTKDKGIEDALKAFAVLNGMGEYRFWVMGKGQKEYVDYLKNLSVENGLEGKVTFFGFVDQKKKFKLLSKAHLLINTSVREGWGLVNIEANSVGTPVVSYRSSGLIDSVKNEISGVLVEENSPEQIAKETDKLLKDKIKYEKLSKSSVLWSRQFSWEKSVKISQAYIKKIYEKGRREN